MASSDNASFSVCVFTEGEYLQMHHVYEFLFGRAENGTRAGQASLNQVTPLAFCVSVLYTEKDFYFAF